MKIHFLPIVLLFVLLFSSCGDDVVERSCTNYFLARVDSMYVPDTVLVSDTIRIFLRGFRGGSSCYDFYQFDSYINNNVLDLEVWGKNEGCTACLAILVGYSKFFYVTKHHQGIFYIIAHQPDGSV